MPKRTSKSDKSEFEAKAKAATSIDPEMEEMIGALLEAEEDVFRKDQFQQLVMETEAKELQSLLEEHASREMESLELFEPMPQQQAFLNSNHRIRIVRGGNRSGKTLITHVEAARILTGRHPDKLPAGSFYLVGADEKHLGDPMWKKLAGWGPFKIIKDPITNKYRAFDFNRKYDRENPKLAKPAPPLIPARFIPKDGVAWLKKRRLIPSQATFTTGWTAHFFSSNARPPKGFDTNWGLFDEEIEGDEWFPEMMRGLVDHGGRFIWGATPQAQTEKLFELHERANDPKESHKVAEFVLRTMDNCHLGEEEKKDFHDDLSPSERPIRLSGEFALSEIHVYPEFDAKPDGPHGINPFRIPHDWTHYVVVDPGVQICGVLFAAVPPDDQFVHIWEELYLRRADAEACAKATKHVLQDIVPEVIIIDHQMGRQTETGSGRSVEWYYAQEFKKAGVFSRALGNEFMWGSTDVTGREQALRKWLNIGRNGHARIRVHRRCENLIWEMSKQRFKPKTNRSQRVRKHDHLVTCAEYLADYDPKWVFVPPPPPPESSSARAMRELERLHGGSEQSSFHSLGPGQKKGAV